MSSKTMQLEEYIEAELYFQLNKYNILSKEELDIIQYQPKALGKETYYFYNYSNRPSIENDQAFHQLNCELKNWLIFYGATAPKSPLWYALVAVHRTKSDQEILRDLYERYTSNTQDLKQLPIKSHIHHSMKRRWKP